MLIGAISGLCHGVTFILLFVAFGTALDEFVEYTVCRNNLANCSESDLDAAADNLIDEINYPIVVYLCVLGILAQCFAWLQTMLFRFSSERQIKRIRILFFRSILRQEIGWFDVHLSGELSSRLNKYVLSYRLRAILFADSSCIQCLF